MARDPYRHSDGTVCQVKWPHRGWIAWNWTTGQWDHREERIDAEEEVEEEVEDTSGARKARDR